MTERAVKIELFDQFARVAQAAASGRRVEIVDVLANGERSVEELSRQVAMSVANTSRHLQVLKEAGLVAATRDGTRVRYRLASPAVYRFWVPCARWRLKDCRAYRASSRRIWVPGKASKRFGRREDRTESRGRLPPRFPPTTPRFPYRAI